MRLRGRGARTPAPRILSARAFSFFFPFYPSPFSLLSAFKREWAVFVDNLGDLKKSSQIEQTCIERPRLPVKRYHQVRATQKRMTPALATDHFSVAEGLVIDRRYGPFAN